VLLLLLGVVAQETAGVYNPGDFVPPVGVRDSVAAVVDEVRGIHGEVYVTQPYYAWLAGKPTWADIASIHDAMRPTRSSAHEELQEELQTALAQHRFAALVLDDPTVVEEIGKMAASGKDWQGYYNVQGTVPGAALGTRPDWVMLHRPPGGARFTPQP
jgi:hypothetical protein